MQGVNVSFVIRRERVGEDGKAPLYVRLFVDDQRISWAVKRSATLKEWNSKQQKQNGNTEEARSINSFLKQIEFEIFEVQKKLHLEGKSITVQAIKDRVFHVEEEVKEKHWILQVFLKHNDQVKQLIGNQYSLSTYKKYKSIYSHTKDFIKENYGVDDFPVRKIDLDFVKGLDFYLRTQRKNNNNSTIKYMRLFGKIVRSCIAFGWLKTDPFLGYKTKSTEVIREFLTMEELQRIIDKDFKMERLNEVRDIFIFSCYTGLAFIDVSKLKRTQIIEVKGQKWINTSRTKTETVSQIPLLPIAEQIIQRYADHPIVEVTGNVLPVLTNQKTNSYLKEIADLCGIHKYLTFHIARHTFATTVTLNNGVSIETVSKMLGHKTIRTTQHYAKILNEKVLGEMMILKEKLDRNGKSVM
jgi:site-specific recombinase XerD